MVKQGILLSMRPQCDQIQEFEIALHDRNTEAFHIQRLVRVLEYKSQIPHDKSKRNKSVRIYEREKKYAIENRKGMIWRREDEANLDAEVQRKQNSNSNSSISSSNSQLIQEDWTGKGNTIVP
ncbi:MAG: hypothetical protein EZS28_025937 [Streblomastix strix]|uniref:Uncharacterized protein n=1 Tax=Streblomastix strix TaxID=222440 RepID=A0A5J4V6T8_9EUKA|nr:MAG: hypothetical protein EZS28_025937 [Streblomastix strix]